MVVVVLGQNLFPRSGLNIKSAPFFHTIRSITISLVGLNFAGLLVTLKGCAGYHTAVIHTEIFSLRSPRQPTSLLGRCTQIFILKDWTFADTSSR